MLFLETRFRWAQGILLTAATCTFTEEKPFENLPYLVVPKAPRVHSVG